MDQVSGKIHEGLAGTRRLALERPAGKRRYYDASSDFSDADSNSPPLGRKMGPEGGITKSEPDSSYKLSSRTCEKQMKLLASVAIVKNHVYRQENH
jgi:hypothetical protein